MPLLNPPRPVMGYASAGFYNPMASGGENTVNLVLNRLHYVPVLVDTSTVFDRITIEVTTAGTTGSVTRLGIYTNLNGLPNALALDAGTVASDSTGIKSITISQRLDVGWWWTACDAQTATCDVRSRGGPTMWLPHHNGGSGIPACETESSISGALPSTASAGYSLYLQQAPRVQLRAV